METGIIQTERFQFAYKKLGKGQDAWLLFHGFGQTSEVFLPVFHFLKNSCSIIAIDLPYHGETIEKQSDSAKNVWEDLIERISQDHDIKTFNFFGHSIGARAILNYLPRAKVIIKNIVFVAADGFYDDFYFHLATKNPIGKSIFKWIKNKNSNLTKYVKMLARLGIISDQKKQLAILGLENKVQLHQVFQVWNFFATYEINLHHVIQKLKLDNIDCLIILGDRDRVIAPKPAKKFASKSEKIKLIELPNTHNFGTSSSIRKLSDTLSTWLQNIGAS